MPSLDLSVFFRKLIMPFFMILGNYILIVITVFLAFSFYALIKYRPPLRLTALNIRKLKRIDMKIKFFSFIRWKIIDIIYSRRSSDIFKPFGLTLYCGRQGSGKTMSMINYANWVHYRYPRCLIVANFYYVYANYTMTDWRDLLNIRNGTDGVLFLIDEIHSEYNSKKWKDFPEELLSEISQQRKQRIKICATSQIYTRVVNPERVQRFLTDFDIPSYWNHCWNRNLSLSNCGSKHFLLSNVRL